MRAVGGRRLWKPVVVGLALITAACSGGGDGASGGLDDEFQATPGEREMQIPGANKLKLGATFAMPTGARGPVPAVLIIPGPGATNRDGPIVARPLDPLYKDLSTALTGAGMATLRYDHRGIGESQLEEGQELTWDEMVADAKEALAFLSQRGEVDGSRLGLVAHDSAGAIALKLAASEPKVKSVALVSAPGRPLVDVWADRFRASNGPESSDAFRAMIGTLLTTGSLPPRTEIRAEFQSSLPPGRDSFHRALFAADPLADARAVRVPVLIVLGERSTSVTGADASRLTAALGGPSEVMVAPNATASLQQVLPPPVRVFDPNNHDLHGLGPPVADAPREESSVAKIATFMGAGLGIRQ